MGSSFFVPMGTVKVTLCNFVVTFAIYNEANEASG